VQSAYYYVRVLQMPTFRWNLYDEIRVGVEFPERILKQIVERAGVQRTGITRPKKIKPLEIKIL